VGSYVNPVLDTDFPDPSILRADDGSFYAYSSQHTTTERWAYIPVARSSDLVAWEIVGDALPERPAWSRSTWECAWGPHVVHRDGTYFLYYSAMADTREGMWLGVATSETPGGPFRDSGEPLLRAAGFAAIDPMAFADPESGAWFLYWGGDYQPIYAQRLAADLRRLDAGSKPIPVVAPSESPYERVVEGPFIRFRDGWYFLFYSGDRFGGEAANYAVMVARSRSPLGPFEKLRDVAGGSSSAILEANERWEGPGHNSIVTDVDGHDWLVYHAIDRTNRWNPGVRFVRRPMLIDRIEYEDGWPTVVDGTPSSEERAAPRV
jgi:arabinan endo-1,5-alpha-L-arabinosidase